MSKIIILPPGVTMDEPSEKPQLMEFYAYEELGQCVANTKALSRANYGRAADPAELRVWAQIFTAAKSTSPLRLDHDCQIDWHACRDFLADGDYVERQMAKALERGMRESMGHDIELNFQDEQLLWELRDWIASQLKADEENDHGDS